MSKLHAGGLIALAVAVFLGTIAVLHPPLEASNPPDERLQPLSLAAEYSADDDVVTFRYDLPEDAFVDLTVFNRIGFAEQAPVHGPQGAGEHRIELEGSELRPGAYQASLWTNHSRRQAAWARFERPGGNREGRPNKAEKILSKIVWAAAKDRDPEMAVAQFKILTEQHPNYEKGAAYYYALRAYISIGDTLAIQTIIDSLLAFVPHSNVYNRIASCLEAKGLYVDRALRFAKMAVDSIDDVPAPWRANSRARYLVTLANVYADRNEKTRAAEALNDALQAYDALSPNPGALGKLDAQVLQDLGGLHESQGLYAEAIRYYVKGIRRNPRSSDLWTSLQRTYALLYGSDIGFEGFRDALDGILPAEIAATSKKPQDSRIFPDFALGTLDSGEVRSADLRGKVTVVNFWAYWCSPCVAELATLEKIRRKYRDLPVTVLAVHSRPGPIVDAQVHESFIRNALAKHSATFPSVVDTAGLAENIGVTGVPTSVILDKQGAIRYVSVGYDRDKTYEDLTGIIDDLLGEQSPPMNRRTER